MKAMQCEVNRADPHIAGSLSIDGDFGPQTQNAVIDFQKCVGLKPDGIVGPNTWSQLDHWSSLSAWPC
ncbi:peptidoglycan-binding domain-containing protein [Kitasatospora aureofaciens]|uniref:peptidoglycan-binding domain-containing protein n=1 Tax=Kitasatospora aureofaciens TaxID=1894 RepID=UPI0033CDEEEC